MADDAGALATAAMRRAGERLERLGEPIAIDVALCSDYSALLEGESGPPASPDTLLDVAARGGRVIVSGRGASGKTTLMNRLATIAAGRGDLPILLDLSRWSHADTVEWAGIRDNPKQSLDLLLRRFQPEPLDSLALDRIEPVVGKIVLADGLNEVPGGIADQILSVLDKVASLLINCSTVVSDRLVRRALDNEARWAFATPLPVAEVEIDRLVPHPEVQGVARALLDSPFFLDRAMRHELRGSALSTIRELIERRGGVPDDRLTALGRAAFLAYAEDRSRSFDPARLAEAGVDDLLPRLLEGGIAVASGDGRIAFAHHWYHDFLASRFVVAHPELWSFSSRQRTLDSLTLKANSFDAIAFAFEQLGAPGSDDFLRAVYDWNPYAAGYALAETEAAGIAATTPALRRVILTMLAEKRFDRHFVSAERAEDALSLFRDPEAGAFRRVRDREGLIALVAGMERADGEFERWRSVFVTPPRSQAPDAIVAALLGDDSIVGWTAANVLKQLTLSKEQLEALELAAQAASPVVRWRACHVLGSSLDPDALEVLLERVVDDSDENVRYGAVRSLVEVASRSGDHAGEVLQRIEPLLPEIARCGRVMAELEKAVFLSRGTIPKEWTAAVSDLLYARASASDDAAEMVEWSRLSSRLRRHEREMAGAGA